MGSGRVRRLFAFFPSFGGLKYTIFNNDADTLVRAILERVLYVRGGAKPPQPNPFVFDRLSKFRTDVVNRVPKTAVMSMQEFVDCYSGRRRAVYASAVESLAIDSVKLSDSFVKHFVKAEKTECHLKEDPVPRLIQPMSPRYNACIGVYLKPLEHGLYRAINSVFGEFITVFKGMNVVEMGKCIREKWDRFSDPVAVGADASRFDQHVSVDALKWEFSVYSSIFGDDHLDTLMKWQLVTRGAARTSNGYVRCDHKGGRASGVMNTACGNVLIMCGLMKLAFEEFKLDAELVNNGDDCVIICERRDLSKVDGFANWFLQFGFTMVMEEYVDVFEEIVFCQMQPVNVCGKWTMCRNPLACLDKDVLTTKPLDRKTYHRMLSTIGEGGLALNSGIPIMQEFYSCMIRAGLGAPVIENDPTFVGSLFHLKPSGTRRYREIDEPTRTSFYNAFKILPDVQCDFETHFREYMPEWSPPEEVLSTDHSEWLLYR